LIFFVITLLFLLIITIAIFFYDNIHSVIEFYDYFILLDVAVIVVVIVRFLIFIIAFL